MRWTVTYPNPNGSDPQGRWTYLPGVRVSTIYRQSSAAINSPPWYWETMAFRDEYDPSEGIAWHSSAMTEREAQRQHDVAVRWFARGTS